MIHRIKDFLIRAEVLAIVTVLWICSIGKGKDNTHW